MRTTDSTRIVAAGAIVAIAMCAAFVYGEEEPGSLGANVFEEIVVTAQKREESINDVPMSIAALSAEQLAAAGIDQIDELSRVVPGFDYTESRVGTPIYTVRGIGFNDIAMGGRPTVSVYQDEALIPFAIQTRGGQFDIERIEVLKGPQGTLFGQNSTGGAINIIAAKPTEEFESGISVGIGRFTAIDVEAFASGALSDTMRARVAVRRSSADSWQESVTRGDELGEEDLTSARLLVEWALSDRVTVNLNVNGYVDRSETPAPHMFLIEPSIPPAAPFIPGLLTYPLADDDNRDADWDAGSDYSRDNSFVQGNLRVDVDLGDTTTLTSITSVSTYDHDQLADVDGTSLTGLEHVSTGYIDAFLQEVRITTSFSDRDIIVLGANYATDETREINIDDLSESTQAFGFTAFGLPIFRTFDLQQDQDIDTYAVFVNVDYQLNEAVSVYGGARYTDASIDFVGCTRDAGDGNAASIFGPFHSFLRSLAGLPPNPPIPEGGCITANPLVVPELVESSLEEDNVSWRFGLDWRPDENHLLYANVSKGYKAGGYPMLGATSTLQYVPTVQESVVAYEAGFKSTLAERTAQLNGALYYYDYQDKQVLGFVPDPIFQRLLRLVNVPESRVIGAELDLNWLMTAGLTLRAALSYVDSEIEDSFVNFDARGAERDFAGEPFPNTPKWQATVDLSYRWALAGGREALVGIAARHQDDSNSELGEIHELREEAYTLVDLRAEVASADGRLRFGAWVRNATDEYYWNNATKFTDVLARFTGMPRTYGVTAAWRN